MHAATQTAPELISSLPFDIIPRLIGRIEWRGIPAAPAAVSLGPNRVPRSGVSLSWFLK